MKVLRRTRFGNPILRQVSKRLSRPEILSTKTQTLIADIRHTLEVKKYGVGLAAPQVGHSLAMTIIGIKPTPSRPDNPTIDMVVINPKIIKNYGSKEPMWEGCISFGSGRDLPYAQVPRYAKIRLRWRDEKANPHERDFEGIVAHVLQHETDHLNGLLFVDKVTDSQSYTTIAEYQRQRRQAKTTVK